MLWFTSRTLCMLSKSSTTELHLQLPTSFCAQLAIILKETPLRGWWNGSGWWCAYHMWGPEFKPEYHQKKKKKEKKKVTPKHSSLKQQAVSFHSFCGLSVFTWVPPCWVSTRISSSARGLQLFQGLLRGGFSSLRAHLLPSKPWVLTGWLPETVTLSYSLQHGSWLPSEWMSKWSSEEPKVEAGVFL
jgi:hypothetical protein